MAKHRALPKHVNRVKKKLTDGSIKFYFSLRSGGGSFYAGSKYDPTSDQEFWKAYSAMIAVPPPTETTVAHVFEKFWASSAVPKGERSRKDQRLWMDRFVDHFGNQPVEAFEKRKAKRYVGEWRDNWKHSPKQMDMAATHSTRLLNWAEDQGYIEQHFCKFPMVYKSERVEIVWTEADVERFSAVAPEWVRRILIVACETGLRPADLVELTRGQIEQTPKGRRLRIRTEKKKRTAAIPVTPTLQAILDATPADQFMILTNASGEPLNQTYASRAVSRYRDQAGLDSKLQLRDTRGTAATRLLNEGLSLAEIALWMAWSPRYADSVIEHYARVSPDISDGILVKLAKAKGGAS